ncbi:hypothetical protein AVEN_127401-1 [Araneus ventricosus]|uniref:Uncharacterized protein n=1 Tax=Araneus ventricosus TaxID=182803 RepID=A0A4Y2GG72_ARAVE|nr:hypothetical protein AVEN_127401-1 [Araneus ventricosus]
MTAGTLRILRIPSPVPQSFPDEKKARAAGVKSMTLNKRGWKLYGDIRTSTVFCLKERMRRSRIDRVIRGVPELIDQTLRESQACINRSFLQHIGSETQKGSTTGGCLAVN